MGHEMNDVFISLQLHHPLYELTIEHRKSLVLSVKDAMQAMMIMRPEQNWNNCGLG